jgi:PIN domain nuclease of toxin-antitoxin system
MVTLELQYLSELGRITTPGADIIVQLQAQVGLRVCDLPFSTVIGVALERTWTRDPFDRIVVGHAAAADAPLVTRDRSIHEHYPNAVWDSGSRAQRPPQ